MLRVFLLCFVVSVLFHSDVIVVVGIIVLVVVVVDVVVVLFYFLLNIFLVYYYFVQQKTDVNANANASTFGQQPVSSMPQPVMATSFNNNPTPAQPNQGLRW